MKILFIQTGGTIDKDYAKVWQAYDFEINTPAVVRILKLASPVIDYKIKSAFKKDSMDITASDRKKLASICQKATEDRIVITHGTDTMSKTAEALSLVKDKIMVLTGAARPEHFYDSDAAFNVGVAVGAIQSLQPGIYIAMNGLVSPWQAVKKNPDTGQFTPKV